jgi:hypothetical protein
VVDYNPAVSAAGQVFPLVDLPSTSTPITAAWLNHIDDVLEDVAASGARIPDVEDGTTFTAVHAVGNSGTSLTITATTTGPVKTITLTGNCTFTLAGATSGRATYLELVLTQDGTGSRTVTWPAAVKWSDGDAPTLSTAAGAIDRVVLTTYNGGTTWFGDLVGTGYA